MSKEALMQVRMDSDIKEAAELLYKNLGTSFAEAIRVFAVQSIYHQGYPFVPRKNATIRNGAKGMLKKYANDSLRKSEETAFAKAMENKYGNTY